MEEKDDDMASGNAPESSSGGDDTCEGRLRAQHVINSTRFIRLRVGMVTRVSLCRTHRL